MEPDTIFQTMDSITNAISDSCEPKIYPDVTLQSMEDKTIVVVEIHPGPMRPYYIKAKRVLYHMSVELPAGKGYCCRIWMLYSKNATFRIEPAVDSVIELKWDKNAKGAISQIKEKQYIEALKDYSGNLLLAGINYDKKTKKHTCVIEKMRKEYSKNPS